MANINESADCYLLHQILTEYNWDNGFKLPFDIIKHQNCQLATALRAFYLADGGRYLQEIVELNYSNQEWLSFLEYLFCRISKNEYKSNFISFSCPLSKIQKYKMLKVNPAIPKVFLDDIIN